MDLLVLGIESSCDETALALVENGIKVLASEVSSSVTKQAVFGGVVPEIAAREHVKALVPLYDSLMLKTGIKLDDIDAIAVTRGPGLIGSLLVGVSFAKSLALLTGKPIIPVDHVHAHLHGALLGLSDDCFKHFPSIGLVVSGGHTNIYYMENETNFELLASTIDDACGECFDKVGKTLGLPYPGGPHIEQVARSGNPKRFSMPMMVAEKNRMEFSYSGLKTHVLNSYKKALLEIEGKDNFSDLGKEIVADLCASFQEAALDLIIRKIQSALKFKSDAKSIIIAGGVAANQRFAELMNSKVKIPHYFPKLEYCSDNAAMIAAYGFFVYQSEKSKDKFSIMNWEPYSRYGQSSH